MLTTLPLLDVHHVRAAIGWIELCNHYEANEELEKVSAPMRSLPMSWKCAGPSTPDNGSGTFAGTLPKQSSNMIPAARGVGFTLRTPLVAQKRQGWD